ncbi:MAG: hypothetical protein HC824_11905 [Synechococcales cyanobacterium RM1_1_8]|nr:hypothetical protein [Synechococcales cyanobacterium RM1_1_8]
MPASDLYSLGVSAIQLLTALPVEQLFDVAEGCWCWEDSLAVEVSDGLRALLNCLLERATRRRYGSAWDVLRDLGDLEDLTDWASQVEPILVLEQSVLEQTVLEQTVLEQALLNRRLLSSEAIAPDQAMEPAAGDGFGAEPEPGGRCDPAGAEGDRPDLQLCDTLELPPRRTSPGRCQPRTQPRN